MPGDGNVYPGTGNIDLDPMLCGPPPDWCDLDANARLNIGSPCIDAGNDAAVPDDGRDVDNDDDTTEPTPDRDLNMRFFDAVAGSGQDVDMGAYENQHDVDCPADFNGDGDVGPFDLAVLLGSWGPCPGCPADLDCDNDVGAADLAILLGSWGRCPGLGGGDGGSEGSSGGEEELPEALGEMGFSSVEEFNAWSESVPSEETLAAGLELLALLAQ